MIKKLRIKFIVLSMLAVLVLLAVIVAAMNITNYNSVVKEADDVLDVLSENQGSFPQFGKKKDADNQGGSRLISDTGDMFAADQADAPDLDDYMDYLQDKAEDMMDDLGDDFPDGDMFPPQDGDGPGFFFGNGGMSPEIPYESRFFSVLLDDSGNAVETEISRIKAVDETTAVEYAAAAFATGSTRGFIKQYRYIRCSETSGTRIIFLDYGRKLEASGSFMLISILTALAGYIVFFFVIVFFSKRMIKPVVESHEKQKRFITDAGHEIKTPLTIIKADAEILEMDLGEGNEWLEDIQKQTTRLTDLTNDLIYLSRTEEASDTTQFIEFPLSDVVEETALSFQGPAKAAGKQLTLDIQPMLSYKGDEKKIVQLVGILLDNALKYSPENGRVSLKLEKQNKNIILTVYNETAEQLSGEQLSLLFDRFYRADPSRNSRKGGYGIGLSMAKAIVESHGGKITAKSDDGKSLKMTVTL